MLVFTQFMVATGEAQGRKVTWPRSCLLGLKPKAWPSPCIALAQTGPRAPLSAPAADTRRKSSMCLGLGLALGFMGIWA